MRVEVKPGRWRMRNGMTVIVEGKAVYPRCASWRGRDGSGAMYMWSDDGEWLERQQTPYDLIEYLGPEGQAGGVR